MTRLLTILSDLISPRLCAVCGCRLATDEETICTVCNTCLPRTYYARDIKTATDNEMARLFRRIIPIERAAALFFFHPHSETARVIYKMKYGHNPQTAVDMGHVLANELMPGGFFEGIDAIVPVPLAGNRQRQRGYNQSVMIARGIGEVTHIKVLNGTVRRAPFKESNTRKDRWQRMDNVDGVFTLRDAAALRGKHILVVDDVVTTGVTVTALGQELAKAGDITISVASLGYTR